MARVNIIEWIAKKLRSLTGIVEDGDTATHAISAGKYVIWKGNPCKASSAISIGDALSSSNLTALTDGVCNDLANETGAKVNKTDIVNNLTTNDSTKVLSAAQGYALNSNIGTLSSLTTTDKTSAVSAINELNAGKQESISVKSVSNIASGIYVMKGGYIQLGKMVIVSIVFKATTGTWGTDSSLFSLPAPYQGDAPLIIFDAMSNPNIKSALCRIASNYVRAGLSLTLNHEYVIQGMYVQS